MIKQLVRFSIVFLAVCLLGAGIYALAGGSSPAGSSPAGSGLGGSRPQGGFGEGRPGQEFSAPQGEGFSQDGGRMHGPVGHGDQEASPIRSLAGITGDLLAIGVITLLVLGVQKLFASLKLRRRAHA